jgi:hypothetical protein
MAKKPKIPRVEGLDDWEMGLLGELRLLKEAEALAPVLDTIASLMAALSIEADRREWQRERTARESAAKQVYKKSSVRTTFTPLQFKPDNALLRRLIVENTASGKFLSRLDRDYRHEIRAAMYAEIAEKARWASVNACRAYVGASM